jgi:hypothetical protein
VVGPFVEHHHLVLLGAPAELQSRSFCSAYP